jgi:hypothetical protein
MTTASTAAASLRAVIAAIDAAEIHASGLERAYLAGAAVALDAIGGEKSPDANANGTDTGHSPRSRLSVVRVTVPAMEHPDLIDLDTGDEFEWRGDGYSHEGDHDFSWPREDLERARPVVEVDSLPPDELAMLRERYASGD